MAECWIYVRLSEDDKQDRLAVTRHEADCRALGARLGLDVAGVLDDNDMSATDPRVVRPGFERALGMPPGTVILCWHTDRFVRRMDQLERVIVAALVVHAVHAGAIDLSTPTGRAVARTVTAWAQHEGEHRAARQKSAMDQARAMGKWAGGRRPLGYQTGMVGLVEDEATAIRDGYRWLLEGVGIADIARRWNDRGMLTTQAGKQWRGEWVTPVLSNPTYAGLRTHHGRIVGEAAWEPLVDRATWEAAMAILGNPNRRINKRAKHSSLLAAIATCGRCGAPMHAGGNSARGGLYVCSSGRDVAVKRGPIDEFVSAVVVARLSQPDVAGAVVREAPDLGPVLAERAALQDRLEGLAGDLDLDELTLARRAKAINARLAAIAETVAAASRVSLLPDLLSAADVATAWERLPLAQQRTVLGELMAVALDPPGRGRKAFNPDTVRIEWRV